MFKKKRHYPPKRPANYRPDFAEYERLKAAWVAENPKADPMEYSEAMRKIAWRCRI